MKIFVLVFRLIRGGHKELLLPAEIRLVFDVSEISRPGYVIRPGASRELETCLDSWIVEVDILIIFLPKVFILFL